MAPHSPPDATRQVFIDASPDEVYRLVSDPVKMVDFAEELYRVRWLRGVPGPAVGSRFRGDCRNGLRHWWTYARVTDADPGRRFAYVVRTPFLVTIAKWQYDTEPHCGGVMVTESAWILAPSWFAPVATVITGEPDRAAANDRHITTTLLRLKQHAESRSYAA